MRSRKQLLDRHDVTKALADITAKVNQVRNEPPAEAEVPSISVQSADSEFAAVHLSFSSGYLVLTVQFNSFGDPFVILLGSVPLAMFGALIFTVLKMPNADIPYWTHGWTTTMNSYAQVGLVNRPFSGGTSSASPQPSHPGGTSSASPQILRFGPFRASWNSALRKSALRRHPSESRVTRGPDPSLPSEGRVTRGPIPPYLRRAELHEAPIIHPRPYRTLTSQTATR